jgi:hypothetical protein
MDKPALNADKLHSCALPILALSCKIFDRRHKYKNPAPDSILKVWSLEESETGNRVLRVPTIR